MVVKIYVEGGGNSKALKSRCREGFSKFLAKAGFEGRMPRIVACGSRNKAFGDFCTALDAASFEKFFLLLVDSEGPITSGCSPWTHLKNRSGDNWDKPSAANDDHVHLMVQCMEAWFLADKDTLKKFYGAGFNIRALPANPNIEMISKCDIFSGLESATTRTSKGRYNKGENSYILLGMINPDPDLVKSQMPYAQRFFDTLDRIA